MRLRTFRGGVHPPKSKDLTCDEPIQYYMTKGDMVFPLSQHAGKPSIPTVKRGDAVLAGQIIAEADGDFSANIVSSCSGKVKAIEPRMTTAGVIAQCIVIQNDGQFDRIEGVGRYNSDDVLYDYTTLSNAEIVEKVKRAGVVGLGGAAFPTHIKLQPPDPDDIDYIIANGAECGTHISCDDRLMQEKPDWIVGGLKILLQMFPHARAVIAIEDDKQKAIKCMRHAIMGESRMEVMTLVTKYPQGSERNLVHAVTGRKMASTDIPANLGCIVNNVTTLTSIYRAVCMNEPLMYKCFTVTGDAVVNPGNFIVRIGTSVSELLEAAGGLKAEPKKVLIGDGMMGMAITDLDIPIAKGYDALVCMTEDPVEEAELVKTNCIRCGRCVRTCPVGLVPQMMATAAYKADFARFEKLHGMGCTECGSCAYVCPAKRPLTQLFKQTKLMIRTHEAHEREKELARAQHEAASTSGHDIQGGEDK